MSTTQTGTSSTSDEFRRQDTGDLTTIDILADPRTVTWDEDGGTDPTWSQFWKGAFSVSAAQSVLIADPTDPLQGAGAATLSRTFAPSGVLKPKKIVIRITSVTTPGAVLTVARKAAAGLSLFTAASDGFKLGVNGEFRWYDEGGDVVGVVTTAVDDGLTISPSAGTIEGVMFVVFGS
jgi:hypothetical protein